MFIINNMIIIKMNFQKSKVVIPFLVVSGISIVMRAVLSSFLAMEMATG